MAKRHSKPSKSETSSAVPPKAQAKVNKATTAETPAHDTFRISDDDDASVEEFDEPGFTFFSKLAPELRRMIWTFALPAGRKVLFGQLSTSETRTNATYQCTAARYPDYPVLLRVNSESRQLALENYILPCHKGPFGSYRPRDANRKPRIGKAPLGKSVKTSTTCFDPARDLLCFKANDLFLPSDILLWIKYFTRTYPTRMSRIRQIEIFDVSIRPAGFPSHLQDCSNIVGHCFLRNVKDTVVAQGPLRHFQNLETIQILPRMFNLIYGADWISAHMNLTYYSDSLIHKPEQKEKCKKELVKYFKMVNDDPKTKPEEKCKVPMVVFKTR